MDSGSQQCPNALASGLVDSEIADWTDLYFLRTKATVARFGDATVTYAVFMRRPVVSAPRLALDWLHSVAAARGTTNKDDKNKPKRKWVGAGEPIMYITGALVHLSDLETILLM